MSAHDKVAGGQGPVTAYVKIPGVDGRSTEISHLKWIETLSWRWGPVPSAGGPSGGGGPGEVVFTMAADAAAQQLAQRALTGEPIAEVRVDFTRDMGKTKRTVMKCVMAGVRIHSGVGLGGRHGVQFSMAYQKIQSESV